MLRDHPTPTSPAHPLPGPCGPVSAWLLDVLASPIQRSMARTAPPSWRGADALVDDDLHLSLHLIYELSYRGLEGVADDLEHDPAVLALRSTLERAFEAALRADHAGHGEHIAVHLTDRATAVPTPSSDGLADRVDALMSVRAGPSLSRWMVDHGGRSHFREFMVHRSAYQLKEADPHTWVIPRLVPGLRKSAFVEIQTDEYGSGRPGETHAELYRDAMVGAGLDASYGGAIDLLPGTALATGNLISMLGMQRRLAPAALGHLAVFEMTSVEPMSRYSVAADRLGFPAAVRRFYDVHVEADTHHGNLARTVLLGGDLHADGLDPEEILFGVGALLGVEERFARHVLRAWRDDRTSFRVPTCSTSAA